MRKTEVADRISLRLAEFERAHGLLPGIEDEAHRKTFIHQIVESIRRIEFVRTIATRPVSEQRRSPVSTIYDPLRAAILFKRDGQFDEACWQVFLSVHFGKSLASGWIFPRDVYGRLGQGGVWGWNEVSDDVTGFREWLTENQAQLKGSDGITRRFGNHRKYTSIRADAENGTATTVESYVGWVNDAGGHYALFNAAIEQNQGDPKLAFASLFDEMSVVRSFGRIGKFDYLTMIGKLELAAIEPDSAYMSDATGPLIGAKLMFGELSPKRHYDLLAQRLGIALNVNMQVIEDALCNWQKSPEEFIAFRG